MIQWEIKLLVNEKFRNFNAYCKNISKRQLRENLSLLQQWLNGLIDDSKQKYFLRLSQKLSLIQKTIKAYWALLKLFLNNGTISFIPPLIHHKNFVVNF